MKVKCITLTSTQQIVVPSNDKIIELSPRVDEFLEIDRIYAVYGFSIWRNGLNYLIDVPLNNSPCPEWLYAGFFEVVEHSLPTNLYFRHFGIGDKRGLIALWGYRELIYDYDHYEGLIEMDKIAIEIFAKRKREIDQYLS